jgi:hypothetical protein
MAIVYYTVGPLTTYDIGPIRTIGIVPRVLFPDESELPIVEPEPPSQPIHVSRCPTKEKSKKKSNIKPQDKQNEIECCSMCLEEMEKPCECTKLPCGHTFHTNCISQLRDSSINNKCPLCRADLPPGTLEEEVHEEERKHYKHNQKVYSSRHCSVLHSQIIYKESGNESNIWCTFPWEYNGKLKIKTKYNKPIPKSRKSNKKNKTFRRRV